MTQLGALVDVSALLQVVGIAIVAGIGVTGAFSLAILGAIRGQERRRGGRPTTAVVPYALAVVATLICVAAVWQGFRYIVD